MTEWMNSEEVVMHGYRVDWIWPKKKINEKKTLNENFNSTIGYWWLIRLREWMRRIVLVFSFRFFYAEEKLNILLGTCASYVRPKYWLYSVAHKAEYMLYKRLLSLLAHVSLELSGFMSVCYVECNTLGTMCEMTELLSHRISICGFDDLFLTMPNSFYFPFFHYLNIELCYELMFFWLSSV